MRIAMALAVFLIAGAAQAGQITIVNQGAAPVGFYLYEGKKYLDSGRANPPPGTATTRQVPDKPITLVLFRGNPAGGKTKGNDRCQIDFPKGDGAVEVKVGDQITCKRIAPPKASTKN